MARERIVTIRMEPERHEHIAQRANEAGISVSEWINRVIEFGLTAKSPGYTITTTKKVTL